MAASEWRTNADDSRDAKLEELMDDADQHLAAANRQLEQAMQALAAERVFASAGATGACWPFCASSLLSVLPYRFLLYPFCLGASSLHLADDPFVCLTLHTTRFAVPLLRRIGVAFRSRQPER